VVTVPVFTAVRTAIQEAGRLSRTELARRFSFHIPNRDITACLQLLVAWKEVRVERRPTPGRPVDDLIWQGEARSNLEQLGLTL